MSASGSPWPCAVEPPSLDVFVCWLSMEMLGVEEPGPRVWDGCQVQFKDCQRANVLPGNVKIEPITLRI